MNKINIHEYPEGADFRALLAYKIAVMQAALDGKPVELRVTSAGSRVIAGDPLRFFCRYPDDGEWHLTNQDDKIAFNWLLCDYRIAAPKIAEGHNPAKVTEDKIESSKGYRLLTLGEINALKLRAGPYASLNTPGVERWSPTFGLWRPAVGNSSSRTYRTAKPAGFYLTWEQSWNTPTGYGVPQPIMPTPAPLAEGHNPDNLTTEQVGVSEGWRLLSVEEVRHRTDQVGRKGFKRTRNIEAWDNDTKAWLSEPMFGGDEFVTYRTKLPKDHFLPAKGPVRYRHKEGWTQKGLDYMERAPDGVWTGVDFDGTRHHYGRLAFFNECVRNGAWVKF